MQNRRILFSVLILFSLNTFAKPATPKDAVARFIASGDNQNASIWYYTYESNTAAKVNLNRWKSFRGRDNARWDLFSKMFFANTRAKSNEGLHHVACYSGNPEALVRDFFEANNTSSAIANIDYNKFSAQVSSDWRAIGIDFAIKDNVVANGVAQLKGRSWHFRLQHCQESGKMAMFDSKVKIVKYDPPKAEVRSVAAIVLPDVPTVEEGFGNFDIIASVNPKLPKFDLRGDYAKLKSDERPWLDMDLTDDATAEKFALVMQQYFYENMANQSPEPDNNFIAQNNSKRDWCHMPWLNVGESGREGVHGLTKERDLNPSPIYPKATPGSDWGIGFYNSAGCKSIEKVFGTETTAKELPDFSSDAANFADGTVSAKILFTTADFPELEGAFTWTANVSKPKSTARSLSPVKHMQMDIAVKDASLKGTYPQLGNWVMITYYYDKTYNSPLKIEGLPEGLRHMRPQGIQYAFNSGGSKIFAGSVTNNYKGQLNGPADNPKSTCLGCHGTSGTRYPMSPGFTREDDFTMVGKNHLDFSQQLALAKRNFETSMKKRK